MANTNKPFGFRLVTDSRIDIYYTNDSTAFYVGDVVKLTGTSGAVNTGDMYRPAVQKATSGDAALGVVVGFLPIATNLELKYHTASTAQYVLVSTDPEARYEIQGDSTTFAVTDIGLNCTYLNSTGSTTTGISNATLTGSTKNTTNTLGACILGFSPAPDNEVGQYSRFIVKLNQSQFGLSATGI
jgi:hypothetical protein